MLIALLYHPGLDGSQMLTKKKKHTKDMLRKVLVKCRLFEVVRIHWPKNKYIGEHSHTGLCLMAIKSGNLIEKKGNGEKRLTSGDYTLSNRNETHSIRSIDESVSYHVYFKPPFGQ